LTTSIWERQFPRRVISDRVRINSVQCAICASFWTKL
jgi:hypothetical protein